MDMDVDMDHGTRLVYCRFLIDSSGVIEFITVSKSSVHIGFCFRLLLQHGTKRFIVIINEVRHYSSSRCVMW